MVVVPGLERFQSYGMSVLRGFTVYHPRSYQKMKHVLSSLPSHSFKMWLAFKFNCVNNFFFLVP